MPAAMIREGAATVERLDPRLLTGEPTYLFNIYSAEFVQNMGTCGMYFIPACPEDREYVRSPNFIPGTVEDTYPHFTDKEEYRSRPTVGQDVVDAVLGIGAGQRPDEDIRRFGVFASKNKTPTKPELAAARERLVKYLQEKIRKGDELFASAKPEERQSIDDSFYRAARYLRVKRPWMSEATALAMCPFCSTPVRPEASICSGCHQVINQAAFDAQKKAIAGV